MELSKRLKTIADMVEDNAVIADIGTDHGYIPIYLAEIGKTKYAYAMDINKGPLEKAQKNIKAMNLDDKIETRLSDGLENLEEYEADTIIIAGMGGMLITNILKQHKNIIKSVKHLILSPHLDSNAVRLTVHELGFKIEEENLVKESGKYYNIMSAKKGGEKYNKDIYYTYGKILLNKRSPVLKEYVKMQLKKQKSIIKELEKQNSESANIRKIQIVEKVNEMNEVLKCL